MTVDDVKNKLIQAGFTIQSNRRLGNNTGSQILSGSGLRYCVITRLRKGVKKMGSDLPLT